MVPINKIKMLWIYNIGQMWIYLKFWNIKRFYYILHNFLKLFKNITYLSRRKFQGFTKYLMKRFWFSYSHLHSKFNNPLVADVPYRNQVKIPTLHSLSQS